MIFWQMEVKKEELSSLLQIIQQWIIVKRGEKIFLYTYPSKNLFHSHMEQVSYAFALKGFYRSLGEKDYGEKRRTSWGKRKWITLFPKKERNELLVRPKVIGAALNLAAAGMIGIGYFNRKKNTVIKTVFFFFSQIKKVYFLINERK